MFTDAVHLFVILNIFVSLESVLLISDLIFACSSNLILAFKHDDALKYVYHTKKQFIFKCHSIYFYFYFYACFRIRIISWILLVLFFSKLMFWNHQLFVFFLINPYLKKAYDYFIFDFAAFPFIEKHDQCFL